MNSLRHASPPWSERVVDGACLVFAGWTLACHATVLAGGSLWMALASFVPVGVGLAAWFTRGATPFAVVPERAEPGPAKPLPTVGRAVVLLAAIASALLLGHDSAVLWWAAVGLLGLGSAWSVLRASPDPSQPVRARSAERLLWAAAVVCVCLALVAHRPDADDSFYLNLAVAAVEGPGLPLLSEDTLHGVPGLPIHHPAYLVHSWELWNAAASLLTGVETTAMFHWVSASLAALLVPFGWARLFRRLAPARWPLFVFAVLCVLCVYGDEHWSIGNWGLVRIWQGKSVLLSVLLPVIASAAIDFMQGPSARRGVFLAATQIAAVGLSGTALWLAPAVALSSAACTLSADKEGLRRLGVALLASGYVLCAGAALQAIVSEERVAASARIESEALREVSEERLAARAERHEPGRQLGEAVTFVLGDGPRARIALVSLLAGWALVPTGVAMRFASIVPFAVFVVLLNPYASDFVSRALVGNSMWRIAWALPIAALLAMSLSAGSFWLRGWLAPAVTTALACVAFGALPGVRTFSPDNRVTLGVPALKVQPEAYRLARIVHDLVEPGAVVVAPRDVSVWLSTFPGRAYPLVVRNMYLRRFRGQLGEADFGHRIRMANYVEGRGKLPDATREFADGLVRFDVAAAMFFVSPGTVYAQSVLRDAGFEQRLATLEYEIWVKP